MRLFIAALTLLFAGVAFAADVTGKWTAKTPGMDGGEMVINFTFKQDGEKLTGTVSNPMGESEIKDGKVTGDNITFATEMGDMKIVHKGTVAGDEIKIKVEIGEMAIDMVAKRAK